MGIKVDSSSFVYNASLRGLVALLALSSGPVLSQSPGNNGAQQNTTVAKTTAKTTPSAAVKNSEAVKNVKGSGKRGGKASGRRGTQASAKPQTSVATPPRSANAAPPKSAQPVMQNAAPVITYISQDAKEWLRAGDMVHITMQGTPAGMATFRVSGLAEPVAMQESAPGRYIGTWTVPADKPLPMTHALIAADLNLKGRAAITMQASRPLNLDTVAPRIQNAAPAAQTSVTTVTPTISADLSDEGSGIDLSATRLIINGRDLSGEADIASDHITYKPVNPLSPGDQTVQLIVSDRAGNTSQQTWHFTVSAK